jgi:hypothetical protein
MEGKMVGQTFSEEQALSLLGPKIAVYFTSLSCTELRRLKEDGERSPAGQQPGGNELNYWPMIRMFRGWHFLLIREYFLDVQQFMSAEKVLETIQRDMVPYTFRGYFLRSEHMRAVNDLVLQNMYMKCGGQEILFSKDENGVLVYTPAKTQERLVGVFLSLDPLSAREDHN